MSEEESRVDRAKRFAKIWWSSRAEAGKSQEFMALGLGVSKKTIQNWERGISSPSLFQGSEWFRLLGLNPIRYYLQFLYPGLFGDISPSDDDEKIKQALIQLINEATPQENRELLFLMSNWHGGSWYALLQMIVAHCHTSLKSRVAVAHAILENYEMDAGTLGVACPDNVQPDLQILKYAIEEAKESVLKSNDAYTIANLDTDSES